MNVQQLFAEHYEALFRYLVRLTGDADAAADATQDAFVRLIERPPQDGQIRAWLFRVATNLVRDESRVRRRRLEILSESVDRAPIGDQPLAPDTALEAKERSLLVREALARLSLRERTVLLMREQGFSHQEIAETVETTTKSVGSMIARALQKLSVELAPFPEANE